MKKLSIFIFIIIALAISEQTMQVVNAEEYFLHSIEKKNGGILLIVDGMGASYLSTYNYTPLDFNGKELKKARMDNLSYIASNGVLVQDIRALEPDTQRGHAIIFSGYSKADVEFLSYEQASIFDVLRSHGYICIAILEKGDFENIIEKQDLAIYDSSNSIDNPSLKFRKKLEIPLADFMLKLTEKLPREQGKDIEKYALYNRWALESANSIANYMVSNYPNQKFFITVNAGGVDQVAHAYDATRYVEVIEKLDALLPELYETCIRNNLSLFITSDHGMKFITANSRGGHASDKYRGFLESRRIPLVIYSPGIESKLILGIHEQRDIAPSILSSLDIVDLPIYADGKAIPLRSYVNLKVIVGEKVDLRIMRGNELVAKVLASNVTFYGLQAGDYSIYVNGEVKQFNLTSDEILIFSRKREVESEVDSNLISAVVISIVTAGLLIISRIARR
ncbi:MAG: sulfatase-like hydrolase/transferase [Methanocellales archaeon]